jgi:hypothetical protein
LDHTVEIRGLAAQHAADSDPHDLALIRGCLRLTPEERLLRLEQAHEFRAAVREAQPYELRER